MNEVKRYESMNFPNLGYVKVGDDVRVLRQNCSWYGKYGIIDRISSYTIEGHTEFKLKLEFEEDGVVYYLDFFETELKV